MPQTITISEPRTQVDATTGLRRVSWDIAGFEVWFESRTKLRPARETPVAAMMIPAKSIGAQIVSPGALDATFLRQQDEAAEIIEEFWGFRGPQPTCDEVVELPAQTAVGQFYTGGVDSMYTLHRNRDEVSYLINIHGYDIGLGDKERYGKSLDSITRVANEVNAEVISVATNLRKHPIFNSLHWSITHIAALVAVGHLLTDIVGIIRIAGSDAGPPWGQNVRLDPLWGSAALQIINEDDGIDRSDKVRDIAGWSVTQNYLKVCWENRSLDLNCGVCEKCIRTQIGLANYADLKDFVTFPPGNLAQRVGTIGYIPRPRVHVWRRMMHETSDPELRRAISWLMLKSRIANPTVKTLKKIGLKKAHFSWLKRA